MASWHRWCWYWCAGWLAASELMNEQITMDDLHIHGGVVQQVVCMGDVHMHGGVVNTMTVQGDCEQHGGVINRRIQSGASVIYQQPEPKVVYRDKIVYRDRVVYKDKPQQDPEQLPSDDILVRKIIQLKNQLKKEQEEHQKQIDELEWRLNAVIEIANERIHKDKNVGRPTAVTDDSLDVLFTLVNEYPFSTDANMAKDFGISIDAVKKIAKVLRLAKSPKARREAKERLQKSKKKQ